MPAPSHRDIAAFYCVDDLPGASIPGTRLTNILECLRSGGTVTELSLTFLQTQGLDALSRLATGAVSYESFRKSALTEQSTRVEAAESRKAIEESEALARKAARLAAAEANFRRIEAERLARESDPRYQAKLKNRELRDEYGIFGYIEADCFSRLMAILKRVDADQRVSEEDFVWLSSKGEAYFTDELHAAYHRLEAKFFAAEFARTGDPWAAVNASGHYRKCGAPRDADSLLKGIAVERQKSLKLKSALCTTHGGVMRDLGRFDEALRLGENAHEFRTNDYRPCTLLGAIHMETSNYALGLEWYEKAVHRGATKNDVDRELRQIYFRADQSKQKEMRAFLLGQDPVRYAWVKTKAR